MRADRVDIMERRRYIVEHVRSGESIRLADVALLFGSTKRSIYNDLALLRDFGLEIRSRGGIIGMEEGDKTTILREISFPPEYKEAGVGILSYFSTILSQRYPETEAAVTITQAGDAVSLKIETSKGDVETVERTLSDYGRVVFGELQASDLLADPRHAMQLQNKLEITALELRLKEQAFSLQTRDQQRRIESLERETSELRSLVGVHLATVQHLGTILGQLAEAERLSPAAARAMEVITSHAASVYSERIEREVKEALETIRREDRRLYGRIKNSMASIGHSLAANLSTPWIIALINSMK